MGLFPETQVLKDLFDDIWLVNEADDAHLSLTSGAGERVSFANLPNEVGPAFF
jgi:hypothetical protein